METTKEERRESLRLLEAVPSLGYHVEPDFTARLCRDVDTLVAALRDLVERLDLIGDDEQFKGVWVLHAVHGGRYTGPTYTAELAAARAVLAPKDREEKSNDE